MSASKTHVALVAGSGIDMALPQIETVLAREDGARLLLFYGNRTTADVASLEELQALKDKYLDRLSLYFLFSGDPQDVELLNGPLDGNKVRELAGTFFQPAQVDEFLLAGPNGAAVELANALKALGVDAVRLRGQEDKPLPPPSTQGRAGAPSQTATIPGASPPAAQTTSAAQPERAENVTQVTVLMDGRRRTFEMPRDGSTVLDAAEQAGLDLPFSCRAGVCSTCRTKVVKGSVEMLQNYALEPWETEQGYVLACQSQPTCAELELDYDDK